jgi:hypothetical protein
MPGIATPFKPVGIGNVNAVNVVQVSFSQALSSIPFVTAYDNYNASTFTHVLFTGSAGNGNLSMIAAVGGTAPGVAVWFPTVAVAGNTVAGTPNFLKGTTNGANISSIVPGAGGTGVFNLGYRFPSDITAVLNASGDMDCAILCQYQYTGAAPTITWNANKSPGTEGAPSWSAIVPYTTGSAPVVGDTTQVRPCDTGTGDPGSGGDGTYRQTIPSSGQAYPNEIWVKNY